MRRGKFKYSIPATLLDTPHGSWGNRAGVLDMMRYDAAQVVDWNHETITLVSEVFTRDRWASFGIYPTLISDMVGV